MLPAKEKTLLKFLATVTVLLLLSFFSLGRLNFFTGLFCGVFMSLVSLFFLSLAFKKAGAVAKEHLWSYFLRGFIVRLSVAGFLLYFFLCIVKINIIGLLVGLLTGLLINTFVLIRYIKRPEGA